MTFIISELKNKSHFQELKEFYDGHLLKENLALISRFMGKDQGMIDSIIESGKDYEGDDIQVKRFFALCDDIAEKEGLCCEDVVCDLKIMYDFYELGITVEPDESTNTLICSLDGTVNFAVYLKCRKTLLDEMDELSAGEFRFAYSHWEDEFNLSLFEELEINDPDHVCYPTLFAGDLQAEPETGHWY